MFVYVIINLLDGKKYVGQTARSLHKRWRVHEAYAKRGSSFYLHRAMRKHGVENFALLPLVIVGNKWEMDLYEIGLIKVWDLRDRTKGYNQTDGGEGTIGRVVSLEARRKIGLFNSGKKVSQKTRRRISKAKKGQVPWSKGVKFSAAYRKKLSLAAQNRRPRSSKI